MECTLAWLSYCQAEAADGKNRSEQQHDFRLAGGMNHFDDYDLNDCQNKRISITFFERHATSDKKEYSHQASLICRYDDHRESTTIKMTAITVSLSTYT